MPGLDSDGAAVPTVILSAIGTDYTPRSTFLTYLLRCPALINLSTKNFSFGTCWSHAHGLCDNHIIQTGFFERGLSGLVQAIEIW